MKYILQVGLSFKTLNICQRKYMKLKEPYVKHLPLIIEMIILA